MTSIASIAAGLSAVNLAENSVDPGEGKTKGQALEAAGSRIEIEKLNTNGEGILIAVHINRKDNELAAKEVSVLFEMCTMIKSENQNKKKGYKQRKDGSTSTHIEPVADFNSALIFRLEWHDFEHNTEQFHIVAFLYDEEAGKKACGPSNKLKGFRIYAPSDLDHLRLLAQHGDDDNHRSYIRVRQFCTSGGQPLDVQADDDDKQQMEMTVIRQLQHACGFKELHMPAILLTARLYNSDFPTTHPKHPYQFRIPAEKAFDALRILVYFIDWSCMNVRHIHYTHLVLCDEGDEELKSICEQYGILLNTAVTVRSDGHLVNKGNKLFLIDQSTGNVYLRNDRWIYVWQPRPLSTDLWTEHETEVMSIPPKPTCDGCPTCNVFEKERSLKLAEA